MRMAGFTAEASLYNVSGYQHEATRSFGNGTKDSQVQMQRPNNQNTAGGKCTGHTSGTTIQGTYDSSGRCCTGADYPGFPFCIDCYTDHCYDKDTDYLQGCFDSCAASLNLCQSFLRPNWRAQIGAIGRAPITFVGP